MTYQKLFNINYNNKEFTIFIDEKNRKTFLELTKDGNYIYPTLEDFTYLHNLYNNTDITQISSSKLSFKECVRYKALTLSVIALLNLTSCYKKSNLKVEDTNLIITEETLAGPNYLSESTNITEESNDTINIITDLKALDTLLGITSVDYDTIKATITNNPNLTIKFQNAANSILNLIINNADNPELRIFYENIQTLKIHELSLEEIKKLSDPNVEAFYDAKENAIYASPSCSPEVALHEMFHVAHFIYLTKDNANYYYGFNIENGLVHGKALEEALTNYYLKDIYGLKPKSYDLSGKITEFLLSNVSYPYTNYNHTGIRDYLAFLKETYPDISIDYIITYMDTLNESIKNNDTIKITSTINSLYDELFAITKTNLDKNNPYAKLIPFLNMISKIEGNTEHFYNYFTLFNDFLLSNDIKTLSLEDFKTKYQNLTQIDKYLIFPNSHVEFVFNLVETTTDEPTYTYQTLTEEGSILTKTVNTQDCYLNYLPNDANILNTILTYPYESNYQKLITNFNRDNTIISPHRYLPVNLIYNDKVIANLNITNNDYDNEINLYIGTNYEGEITYSIAQNNNLIFTTDNNIKYVSNPIPLSYYLTEYWYEEINLNAILSTDYLTEFLKKSNWFSNVSLKDSQIIVTPLYKINYTDKEYGTTLIDITDIYLSKTSDINSDFYVELTCGYAAPTKISINPDLITDMVTLKEVMSYFNMLDENITTYSLTKEEIENLFLSYYDTLSENKAR